MTMVNHPDYMMFCASSGKTLRIMQPVSGMPETAFSFCPLTIF